MKHELYDFQRETVEEAIHCLENTGSPRVLTICPTGSGKTLILAAIAGYQLKLNPNSRILSLVHLEEVLRKTGSTFINQMSTVSTSWFTGSPKEKDLDGNIVFGMVKSVANRIEEFGHFDMLIVDEAHHIISDTYRDIIAYLLRQNPALKIVGCTATVQRSDNESLDQIFEQNQVVEGKDYPWLIANGYLVTPQAHIFCLLTEMSELEAIESTDVEGKSTTLYRADSQGGFSNSEEMSARLVCTKYKEFMLDRKTLGFVSTIQEAELYSNVFNGYGVKSAYVTSRTPAVDRLRILRDFKDGRYAVVFNVNVFTEGFDDPSINGIILTGKCHHPSVAMQKLGRGLRKTDVLVNGKPKTDCLIIDFGNTLRKHTDVLFSLDSLLETTESDKELGDLHGLNDADPEGKKYGTATEEEEAILKEKTEIEAKESALRQQNFRALLSHDGQRKFYDSALKEEQKKSVGFSPDSMNYRTLYTWLKSKDFMMWSASSGQFNALIFRDEENRSAEKQTCRGVILKKGSPHVREFSGDLLGCIHIADQGLYMSDPKGKYRRRSKKAFTELCSASQTKKLSYYTRISQLDLAQTTHYGATLLLFMMSDGYKYSVEGRTFRALLEAERAKDHPRKRRGLSSTPLAIVGRNNVLSVTDAVRRSKLPALKPVR